MISASRRMDLLRLGEDSLSDQGVDRTAGDQIDRTAEDDAQFGDEIDKLPSESRPWRYLVQEVDVAVRPRLPAAVEPKTHNRAIP